MRQPFDLLVLDVDGVLTDGRLWYGANGEELKAFHVRDGHGIKLARSAGIVVAVISGRESPAVQHRCRELGIGHVIQGCADKAAALRRLCTTLAVSTERVVCIGDDTPDLAMFAVAGLAIAVADAHAAVRAAAARVTTLPGGSGAVREICDWLLGEPGA